MTYIVNDLCIKCKYTDCVEVCPVDCFYEGENMLVIHPDECIDCGVCEPECPADAIFPDSEPGTEKWVEINGEYAELWPNITRMIAPMPDATVNTFIGVNDEHVLPLVETIHRAYFDAIGVFAFDTKVVDDIGHFFLFRSSGAFSILSFNSPR